MISSECLVFLCQGCNLQLTDFINDFMKIFYQSFVIIIIYSRGDIREVEFRLDKEGKEFHHFEEFAKMYRAEVG